MTSKETMYKAINTYGVENQMIKTVEELSELSQALCKILTSKFTDDNSEIFENIFEEPYMMAYFWSLAGLLMWAGFLRESTQEVRA